MANRGKRIKSTPVAERIQRHVERREDGCLIWTGATNSRGRPYVQVDSWTLDLVTRVVWRLAGRDLPDGMHLHHTCQEPRCVELSHLAMLTPDAHRQEHRLLRLRASAPRG
jgi:hypothetical protein